MAYVALRELLTAAGQPYPDDGNVEISGDGDPVLRTRYKIGTSAAAAQAAIGVAISELWKLQSGRSQRVTVDLRTAAIAMRGRMDTLLDGQHVREDWENDILPQSMFFPVREGRWIRFSTSYPHMRDIVLRILNSPKDTAAARAASSTWDGEELEEAVHAAGGCAGLVRAREEWLQHPQARAVAAQPLLEIVRIGDAPLELLPARNRPLAGVRVLDLTRVIAGPACGRMLAEHGADVLKIHGKHLPNFGASELDSGLGKLSAFLDLRTAEDAGTLRGLLGDADVFLQGYRPGSLAARGFSPAEAARLRPGIVYAELSAWSTAGPWKDRRGYDPIVQAVSGMALEQGGGLPASVPASPIDYLTGYLVALGIVTALRRRALEGGSWLVRASLARSGQWIADRGFARVADIKQIPDPLETEIEGLSDVTESPAGRVRHLRPVLQLSDTPAYWARPPVLLGYHQPIWPKRDLGVPASR